MKATFAAVTVVEIRCRLYTENQMIDQVGAAAAWEWHMLNPLAILTWQKTVLGNEFTSGPRAAERAKEMTIALRSRMDTKILGTRFFCTSAPLRRASVRERAFSDCEARWERAKRFLIVASIRTY